MRKILKKTGMAPDLRLTPSPNLLMGLLIYGIMLEYRKYG